MLEIKILISDLDYDGVVELAAPLAAEKLAQKGGLMGRLACSVGGLKKLIYNKYLAGKTQDQREVPSRFMRKIVCRLRQT